MIDKSKRKAVEEKVFQTLLRLEPSGKNAEKYKTIFKAMSDKEFENYFKEMKKDFNNNFYVEMDLHQQKPVNMESIQAAANYLKLPLEEHVFIRHMSDDGQPIKSRFKVPVMYVHLKRMQQILSKKNRANIDIMKSGSRSKLTGSLNDREKTGRLTDADTLALLAATNNTNDSYSTEQDLVNKALGLEPDNYILKEILGARADNLHHKMQMQSEISTAGKSNISVYSKKAIHGGQALNTLDVFLVGAGLKSNLITGDLMMKQGIAKETERLRNES